MPRCAGGRARRIAPAVTKVNRTRGAGTYRNGRLSAARFELWWNRSVARGRRWVGHVARMRDELGEPLAHLLDHEALDLVDRAERHRRLEQLARVAQLGGAQGALHARDVRRVAAE